MRDKRFVAAHRGGQLSSASHAALATWAADCAERVLCYFQQHSDDDAPEAGIAIARRWARGEIKTGVAQRASVAAHAAARSVKVKSAISAARAAGQAVATAHFADHCVGAAIYAIKALKSAGADAQSELVWQIEQVPQDLHMLVLDNLKLKLQPPGVHAKLS